MKNVIFVVVGLLVLAACAPAASDNDANATTTASGLQYIEIEKGTGPSPQVGQTVLVHYTGRLEDGTQFDSSRDRGQPFAFPLGMGQVIPGWDEGIALMQVGGKAQLIIPPELGYGAGGAAGVIPPNATLIFDVELVDVEVPATAVPAPPPPTPAPGEQVTASGLRYIIREEGDGPQAQAGDTVRVHYVGTLPDGTQFDSSRDRGEPFVFPLGQGRVIRGWDEGIALLKVGGSALLIVPPDLAYGSQPRGEIIMADATLLFEVELLEILPAPPESPTVIDEADYTTTESGLRYYDFEVGTGGTPAEGDTVSTHFTAWLDDGTSLGSSLTQGEPISFVLGSGNPLPGWDEGVSTMQYGGKRQLVLPPELAFGVDGDGGSIPANATVIIELELVPPELE